MRESRIRLLALCYHYTEQLSYFDDWLDAFSTHPEFSTTVVNIAKLDAKRRVKAELARSDGVVLLHSTNGDTTVHLDRLAPVLAARRCPLLSFVGNEVNLPGAPIAEKRSAFERIRPDWIATQLLYEAGQYLFGDLASRGVVSIPHALNPEAFRPITNQASRPIDIGARAVRYPPHLGDDDRNRISDRFLQLGLAGKLIVDVSNKHFDRDGWATFLNQCKGTVSSEAGSWYIERDDATINAIRECLWKQKGGLKVASNSKLLRASHRIPPWARRAAARSLRALGFRYEYQGNKGTQAADIQRRFFADKPRSPFYGKCISSRHFDAIGTKTCQVMFRGRFNGILKADQHYLAVHPDFGNLDEILRRFSDIHERNAIVECAYEHIMAGHTYAHRMRQVANLLRSAG